MRGIVREHLVGEEEKFELMKRGYFMIDEEDQKGFHFYFIDNYGMVGCITSSEGSALLFAMNFLEELSEKL